MVEVYTCTFLMSMELPMGLRHQQSLEKLCIGLSGKAAAIWKPQA
jgi:hypothetical protein